VALDPCPCDLPTLERPDVDAVLLFACTDERPLQGLAGLMDWRLAGGLSRLLKDGALTGGPGESLLTPAPSPGPSRVFVFGLGPSASAAQRFAEVAKSAAAALHKAGMRRVLVGPPWRPESAESIPALEKAFHAAALDGFVTSRPPA